MAKITIKKLDWCIDFPTSEDFEIETDEYWYFILQFRFGRTCWLIPVKNDCSKPVECESIQVNPGEVIKLLHNHIKSYECITTGVNFAKELNRILSENLK